MRPDQGEQQNYYNGMEEIQVDIIIKKKVQVAFTNPAPLQIRTIVDKKITLKINVIDSEVKAMPMQKLSHQLGSFGGGGANGRRQNLTDEEGTHR